MNRVLTFYFPDDLFAFTIKMPTLHRLATLRDDVIFFIYLYQRWAYRIDYSRVNEFGQGGADGEDEGEKKDAGVTDGEKLAAIAEKGAETVSSGKAAKEKARKRK